MYPGKEEIHRAVQVDHPINFFSKEFASSIIQRDRINRTASFSPFFNDPFQSSGTAGYKTEVIIQLTQVKRPLPEHSASPYHQSMSF